MISGLGRGQEIDMYGFADRSAPIALMFLSLLFAPACGSSSPAGPDPEPQPHEGLIIDHLCADLGEIPAEWVDSVQAGLAVHYAHTSHGSQLVTGLEMIEEQTPAFDVEIGYCELPDAPGALRLFDGQESETYITPDLYWQGEDALDMTRAVLDGNPSLNVSMWSWCTQCDYYSAEEVQDYLESMALLESEYPGVTFVYMTGNAQAEGAEGYNRSLRNQQIRDFCEANDCVLFDFEDLDSWWFDPSDQQWEQATATFEGHVFPVEHPEFEGDEAGHTTYESCIQKGSAVWWMMARIAGWESN